MKKQTTLLTKAQYLRLVTKAKEFAFALVNLDVGYTNPQSNYIALEGILVGWLRASPEWCAYDAHCVLEHPRENMWVVAADQATQAIEDALWSPQCSEMVSSFYSWDELQARTQGQAIPARVIEQKHKQHKRLAAQVSAAAKRIGLMNFKRQRKGFSGVLKGKK